MTHYHHDANFSIEAFRAAHPRAFEQVFRAYYRPLCYFAEKLMHDQTAAEDIVIDVLIKLFRAPDQFETALAIKAFLFISVRNACTDHRQALIRHARAHKEIALLATITETDPADYREQLMAQVIQLLYQRIEALPPQCKTIFKRIYLQQQRPDRIARDLHLSPQTVRNQKTLALRLLRGSLSGTNAYPIDK